MRRIGVVRRLVDREPHDVVRIDEHDSEEPRLVAAGCIGTQPRRRVRRDDRIEVHAGAGPTHEVPVVALPIREAVRRHVGRDGLREVPLADVARPVARVAQDRSDRRDRRVEFEVLGPDHVVDHAVLGQILTGDHRCTRRRARRAVRVVVRELQTLGEQALAPRQPNRRWQPVAIALLVGDDEQDVGTSTSEGAISCQNARRGRAAANLDRARIPDGK